MKKKLIFLLACFTQCIVAQDSFLDQAFGDKGRMNFSFLANVPTQIAKNGVLLGDGRLLVTGNTLNDIDLTKNMGGIAVIKPNGRLDSTELINGKLPFDLNIRPVENITPQSIRALSNGTYIMSITQGKTSFSNHLILKQLGPRFTFSPNFGTNAVVTIFSQSEKDSILIFNHNLIVQTDDRILVSYRRQYQPKLTAAQVLLRFNADGSADKSFGNNGQVIIDTGALNKQLTSSGVINNINISILKQNKIIVVGDTIIVSGGSNTSFLKIIKYNFGGIIDSTFGANGIFKINSVPLSLRASAVDMNDNIYVAGISPPSLCIMKIKPTGVLDSGFADKGIFLSTSLNLFNPVKMVFNQAQEPMILGLLINQIQVISLKTNGILNTSFGNNGSVIIPLNKSFNAPVDISVLSNGRSYIVSRLLLNESGDLSNIEIIKLTNSSSTPVSNTSALFSRFKIFPNPAHEIISIQNLQGVEKIELIDLTGKIVFHSIIHSNQFHIPALAKGNYVMNAYAKNNTLLGREKLILE